MIPLSAKLAGGAALVACLTLLTLWQVAERRADRLAGHLLTSEQNLNTCRGNVNELVEALEAQNQALERLRDEGEARTAETSERLSSRDIERAVAQARAQWLRDRPIQGADECSRVFDVIDHARARP